MKKFNLIVKEICDDVDDAELSFETFCGAIEDNTMSVNLMCGKTLEMCLSDKEEFIKCMTQDLEIQCGLCSMTIEEISKLKENTVDIEERLKTRIAEFKEIDDFKTLYENTLQMKNEIMEILARNYDGRSFSEDETADIMRKFEPVNQVVAEETLKLLKKTSASYFMNEEDSDLPF